MTRPPFLLTVMLLIGLALALVQVGIWPASPAYAQDDDGGDDDDDDGGGSGNDDDDDGARSTGGGNAGRPAPTQRRPAAPVAPPIERPAFADGELVSTTLNADDLSQLLARGYRVIEERPVPQLGVVARRLAVPAGVPLATARDEVRALASGGDTDFNHYYRTEQAADPAVCDGPHCASFDLIGWNAPAGQTCTSAITVGVIDTGINPDHPTFAAARLEVFKLTPGALEPSRAVHGTAVTALLIGDPDSRSPGLLPGARVIAVDAFHTDAGDERADVYTLIAALDLLAARGIRVVNLSFAGPPNTVMERGVAALAAQDVVLVAAAGNAGPAAEPAYPAAYPDVLAVTAIDRDGNIYRRAGRGPHVDLAAPGVDIWTAASIRGARAKTGTSFAVPFVTAAAAFALAANPQLSARDLAVRLTATAKDLGEPGFDAVYGHGLVQAGWSCPDVTAPVAPAAP